MMSLRSLTIQFPFPSKAKNKTFDVRSNTPLGVDFLFSDKWFTT